MAQRYTDGAQLPYRVVYKSKGTAAQEIRFSQPGLARDEVEKLIRRGHSVDLDLWQPERGQYVTQERFN